MTRLFLCSGAALLLFGCEMGHQFTPDAGLDARLTGIEHARRMPAGRDGQSRGVGLARGDARRGYGATQATGSHPANVWNAPFATLSLSDFGEQPVTKKIELADQRETDFLRRPPLDSFWDTVKRDVKHMPGDLWRDTKRVYTNPVNLVILGTAYGGSLALQETGPDDSVEDHFRRGHHHIKEDWRDAFNAVGNPGTHFALAGVWYLLGQQSQDEKTYEVGKTMFSALIINGLTTLLGQAATADRSPNGGFGTLPSGHTSSSFVMASVLHRAYGHAVGIPLYGLATLVAAERIDSRDHNFADVVMGGVLGMVVGHAVASGRDPEFFGWKVVPYVSPESGGNGIALMKSF